jgi:hypothetical protein
MHHQPRTDLDTTAMRCGIYKLVAQGIAPRAAVRPIGGGA